MMAMPHAGMREFAVLTGVRSPPGSHPADGFVELLVEWTEPRCPRGAVPGRVAFE